MNHVSVNPSERQYPLEFWATRVPAIDALAPWEQRLFAQLLNDDSDDASQWQFLAGIKASGEPPGSMR